MSTFISRATGNLMTTTTWHQIEAGAGSSQATISASTNTTAAYVTSAAFTITNLINQIGVLMHCKQTTTTGTVTVGLSLDNGATYTREVTVNATDLPTAASWVLFLFGSAVAGDGGNDNKIGIKGSSAGNATFWRDATAGNWARILVTDTDAAAIAAADVLYIVGDVSAAGAGDDITVTMNDTASTDFGAITIGHRGTFASGVAASTAYTLKVSGDLTVWAGGTFNMPGTAMPSTSSLDVTFDCGSNVQYGLILKDGSTTVIQGNPITYTRTFLAADAAANATELTTSDSTGWASGDLIAVASTTRTASQTEQGDLNGAASGTTLTVHGFAGAGGGLANAHSGTTPTRAEIINLTRNVRFAGASAANQTYILINSTANFDADYAAFSWMGSNTSQKRGFTLLTTTGAVNIQYCALYNFAVAGSTGVITETTTTHTGIVFSNNVVYNIAGQATSLGATTGTWTISGNIFMLIAGAISAIELADLGGTLTNNTVVSPTGPGYRLSETFARPGTFSGNTVHSGASYGMQVGTSAGGNFAIGIGSVISTTTIWRMSNSGLVFNAIAKGVLINGLTAFGNTTYNLDFASDCYDCTIRDATLNGDTTFATNYGIHCTMDGVNLKLETVSLGVASGILSTHAAGDLYFTNTVYASVHGEVVTFASATGINNLANAIATSYVSINRYGGTANDHRLYRPDGSTLIETTLFKITPSERMFPEIISAGTYGPGRDKYESAYKYAALDAGDTITIKVWVYKSVVGDGEAYGGNQPRLMVKANAAIGTAADTVLATMTADAGNWEQLSGTVTASGDGGVAQVYVDCDGTVGSVVVDSWSAQGAKGQEGQGYWLYGQPAPGFQASSPSSYGFVH